MGFPCICIVPPKSLVDLVCFLNYTKHVVLQIFFYTGMFDSSEALDIAVDFYSQTNDSPSSIKSRLPVVEFADFSKGWHLEKEYQPVCAVCLLELEAAHEVRELGNCFHAFHKGCMDKWVDLGNVNCPLCRAHVLPKGMVEKDNNLSLLS